MAAPRRAHRVATASTARPGLACRARGKRHSDQRERSFLGHAGKTGSSFRAFERAVQQAGGTVRGFYLTMGRYDIVVGEAPDDEAAARLALATGALGDVSTETLRAFTEDEFRKLIAALP
ncbi:MAG TPA: GYD domain-containing protein [Candidatus Limnocylindria bacterium]|nr:GYD domain-containing protein [Candidatus Limnocylindria bacterium]